MSDNAFAVPHGLVRPLPLLVRWRPLRRRFAGAQSEEQLAPSVVAGLSKAIADAPGPGRLRVAARRAAAGSTRCRGASRTRSPTSASARELLATVHYEATRAGLDPQLVLGVI